VADPAWAPGEDGPNLRRTTPKNPVRLTAGEPACSRPIGPLGVISAPRNSRGCPESRSRESRPTTRRPLEPHRRNGGWRHPPPSGSPSGPVGPSGRNSNPDSRSNRVGPSGQLSTVGAQEVAVKATLPLARRVCPAHDGLNYFDGISGDAPSPRAKRARRPPVQ
jgi:hypothetical protein